MQVKYRCLRYRQELDARCEIVEARPSKEGRRHLPWMLLAKVTGGHEPGECLVADFKDCNATENTSHSDRECVRERGR